MPSIKKNAKLTKPVGKPATKKTPKAKKEDKPVKKQLATTHERPIVYEEYGGKIYTPNNPMTQTIAKDILGWTDKGFDDNPLFKDEYGKDIWCFNNLRNRPIYWGKVQAIKQDILRGRWQLNGHSMSVGKTRMVLNGQHRLIAFILACQIWEQHPGQYNQWWKTEPVLTTFVSTGIEETDDVINSYDIGKSRTLMDGIYQSQYFSKLNKSQRKMACRATDYAVRLLWERTGVSTDNPFVKVRTMSEAIGFVNRHPKLLEMVAFVINENKGKSLVRFHSPGYMSALLYLMGTCDSERENDEKTGYIQVTDPTEDCLDFSTWDDAQKFATLLSEDAKELSAVREVYGAFKQDYISVAEKNCVLISAWNAWIDDRAVVAEEIAPTYERDGEGFNKLVEHPSVGGIDFGVPLVD